MGYFEPSPVSPNHEPPLGDVTRQWTPGDGKIVGRERILQCNVKHYCACTLEQMLCKKNEFCLIFPQKIKIWYFGFYWRSEILRYNKKLAKFWIFPFFMIYLAIGDHYALSKKCKNMWKSLKTLVTQPRTIHLPSNATRFNSFTADMWTELYWLCYWRIIQTSWSPATVLFSRPLC